MPRRLALLVVALGLLALPQIVGAQSQQVGSDYFSTNPNTALINFDTDPASAPIADGTLLQNVYSSIGVTFDGNDRAVAFDCFGFSTPNQATGSADELEDMNVYFARAVDAVGAFGYDFIMRAYDKDGALIKEVSYTDGRVCPACGSWREQRFLGIAADRGIRRVQFLRYYQDQTACGFRIDDLQFIAPPIQPMPTPIGGNLHINWNSCAGTSGSTPYVTFDCDPLAGSLFNLVGSFQLVNPLPGFLAMDVSLDFILDGQTSMAPFWHYESGGCNYGGVGIEDAFLASCVGYANPWGPGGSAADAYITAYQPGRDYANYGRLLASVARPSDNPVNLAGNPTRYYGWTLGFAMDNAGTCAGCNLKASLRVNSVILYDGAGGGGYLLDPSSFGSEPCVSVNDGGGACSPTAVKKATWGQLKALYR